MPLLFFNVPRCLCVVSPLRAKQLLKTKVMVILILLIYVLVMGGSMIFNVKFDVGLKVVDVETNATMYVAVLSQFYIKNKLFVDIIYNYILAISIPFISLAVVVVSTSITVLFLRRAFAWKQTSANITASETKETVVTKMLLLVCYVYVVCVTPSVANAFVVQFFEGWLPTGRYSNTFYVYVALMHTLTALNSSVNFFIYYSRGTKFRGTLRKLCCCGNKPQTVVENATSITTNESQAETASDVMQRNYQYKLYDRSRRNSETN